MENKCFDHAGQRMTVNAVKTECHGLLTTDHGRHDRLGRGVGCGLVPSRPTENTDRALLGVPL